MDIIDILSAFDARKELVIKIAQEAPSHMGYLDARELVEALDPGIEYRHTLSIALLGRPTHHLHSDTNAEDGPTEPADHIREAEALQIGHSFSGITHSGEDHTVGPTDGVGICRELPLCSEALKGISEGAYVAHAVINNCYHKTPLLEGKE